MQLNRGDYTRLMEELGMWGFPRRIGTPWSQIVANPSGFFRWFDTHWDTDVPMFISHNPYQQPAPGAKIDVNSFVFRTAFGDFDTGDGNGMEASAVFAEAQTVARDLVKHNHSHAWKYSGSDGGFHSRPFFAPEPHDRRYLDRWENAYWRGMKHELGLRSINIRCADPQRMERLPFTQYVHAKDKNTAGFKREANWCVPVPYEMMLNGTLDDVKALSREPRLYLAGSYRFPGELSTLEDVVHARHWETFGHEINALHPMPSILPTGTVASLNSLYIPNKKCLQVLPFGPNPKHSVRLAWIVEVLSLGLTLEEGIDLCDRLAEEAQWEDRINTKRRQYYVKDAWRKVNRPENPYRPYSCDWLRESGCCVGSTCPLFKRAFPDEWEAEQKAAVKP